MGKAFSRIAQGLNEAIEHSKGGTDGAVVHAVSPPDIKRIRAKVGMSQDQFASAFGISIGTLRHWERGDRIPHGAALVLLNVVEQAPRLVLRAIARSRRAQAGRALAATGGTIPDFPGVPRRHPDEN